MVTEPPRMSPRMLHHQYSRRTDGMRAICMGINTQKTAAAFCLGWIFARLCPCPASRIYHADTTFPMMSCKHCVSGKLTRSRSCSRSCSKCGCPSCSKSCSGTPNSLWNCCSSSSCSGSCSENCSGCYSCLCYSLYSCFSSIPRLSRASFWYLVHSLLCLLFSKLYGFL